MTCPDGMTREQVLRMLLASCERLRHDMGGAEATKNCTGLIDKWDSSHPTIYYLERNMRWARSALDKASP